MTQHLSEALNCLIRTDNTIDIVTILNENILECLKILNVTIISIVESPHLLNLNFEVIETSNVHWKFICTSCHIILCLKDTLKGDTENLLSLCQQKNIRSIFQFVVTFGILPSLIAGVGLPRDDRTISSADNNLPEKLTEFEKYSRLKSVCKFINEISKQEDLKAIIYTNFLGDYLAALFQLCYAPIAKPNTTIIQDSGSFTMNEQLWMKLQTERIEFKNILDSLILNTSQPFLIKELIILQGKKNPPPPNFMKKALSKHLSNCLISHDGLMSVMKCFLDSSAIDIGSQWKHIDLITRLISVKHGLLSEEEYLNNICDQLKDIMLKNPKNDYMVVAAACVSSLFEKYKYTNTKCLDELIKLIISPLLFESKRECLLGTIILTFSETAKIINTLDLCFIHPKLCLPSHFLTPIIYPLFCLRILAKNGCILSSKLNNLITCNFLSKSCQMDNWFSALIFGKSNEEINADKNILFENTDEGITAKFIPNTPSVESCINCLMEIIADFSNSSILACNLFIFLLKFMSQSNFRRESEHKKDLQLNENETKSVGNQDVENYLIITKALENLAIMECVLNNFKIDPSFIIQFIVKYLEECAVNLENNSEYSNNEECITICLILLSTLVGENNHDEMLKPYMESIKKSSHTLLDKSTHEGVKLLSQEVCDLVSKKKKKNVTSNSKFEQAITEICDCLLPVRAHGLMQLTKLLEEKDPETVSKKHYVLCIFQENLKDDDSYVYLTAINGLASLAKYSTDDVLEIMSKEFLNVTNKSSSLKDEDEESIKLRMKIGELLVKITKNLGEMAVVHKNILLNTFLCGCRDPDDMIRASSLSNLAELAEVLSYKLGSIIFEILSCMHSIIQSDKSPECRRASVMVISSLIKGLGTESLFFLKEALLPMYRTLKQLHGDEKEDAAVRLHAQIALEELNSIMKELMAPYLRSNNEKDN